MRIHELLLSFAGRLDDDALSDARQMLASAELDRSLEFIAGCVVAGNVVLSKAQHRDLDALFAETYLDPSLIERVLVRDPVPAARHRFAVGDVEGREPERGVADAIRPVLGVLPDVRTVWCVWRLTPSGPASGPVPHRVVLIGVGPGGFPPATAYRADDALRRSGIRASVEVMLDGTEPDEYHREALRCARQVPFGELSGDGPQMSPVEPVRSQPFGGEPRHSQVQEPPRPVTVARPSLPPVEPPRADVAEAPANDQPLPPPVELPQAVPALSPAVELRRSPEPVGELPPPVELHPAPDNSLPRPSKGTMPPPIEADAQVDAAPDAVQDPGPAPGPRPVPSSEPRSVESTDVFSPAQMSEEFAEMPDLPPPAVLHGETPTNSRPAPRRRVKPKEGTRPRLVPAGDGDHAAALADDILNTQERNLLRELQDELARREHDEQSPSPSSSTWFGRHGTSGPDAGPPPSGPMPVNGMPPNPDGRGYPPMT